MQQRIVGAAADLQLGAQGLVLAAQQACLKIAAARVRGVYKILQLLQSGAQVHSASGIIQRYQQRGLGLGAGMRPIRGQGTDLLIQRVDGGVYRFLLFVTDDVHGHVGNGNGKFLSHNILLSLAKGAIWVYNNVVKVRFGHFYCYYIYYNT